MPVYQELLKNGAFSSLISAGAIVKTAFCGPCFGAGDTPANGALSIRHSTRNFPNREGSKIQNGQLYDPQLAKLIKPPFFHDDFKADTVRL